MRTKVQILFVALFYFRVTSGTVAQTEPEYELFKKLADLPSDTLTKSESLAKNIITNTLIDKPVPKPSKAAIMSAIIPGAGQIHNRQYYKLPLVYGGIGAMIYFIDFNKTNYELYRDAYYDRVNGIPNDYFPDTVPDQALRNVRDQYRKNMEWSYIGLGAMYLLNITDAFVSAHLSSFNIDDDLSIDITPNGGHLSIGGSYASLGIVLRF